MIERLEVVDGLVELASMLDGGVQHDVEVFDHLADGLVTVGQREVNCAVWSRMSLIVPP